MVMNAYAHKNGSQIGINPKRLFLKNISTPVLTNIHSEIVIPIRPRSKADKSFFSLLMDIKIIIEVM